MHFMCVHVHRGRNGHQRVQASISSMCQRLGELVIRHESGDFAWSVGKRKGRDARRRLIVGRRTLPLNRHEMQP